MDYTLILIAIVLVVFIFFQFRSTKRRQKEAAERTATIVPGVEVMTNFGLYGTLVSIDEDDNIALVEIAPKTIVKIHRQAILKAVVPVVAEPSTEESAGESDSAGPELNTSSSAPMAEPEYGERTKKQPRKKPSADSE